MHDAFNETLRSWHNFYFMTGGASAGLLGLTFVALSLGMNLITETSRTEFTAFVTPSVYYFVSVLLICAIMLAPAHEPPTLGLILGVGAVIGLILIAHPVRLLIRGAVTQGDFNVADWLGQIIGPVLGYGLVLLAAAGFGFMQASLAFSVLRSAAIVLLLCAISNTWSLVIWIIIRRQ
jgi:hypothetical protein